MEHPVSRTKTPLADGIIPPKSSLRASLSPTDAGEATCGEGYRISFTPFLPATVLRGPFRVREFVRVR